MLKKIFLIIIFVFVFTLFPNTSFAKDLEFSTSYQSTYDVLPSGETSVAEEITLENLTDKYFASSLTVIVGATNITDIKAYDLLGELETEIQNEPNKTLIKVKFNQEVTGKGKKYNFSLKFKTSDFARKYGQIWQISIPKITDEETIKDYLLSLLIPVSFGEPVFLSPAPDLESEVGGKLVFSFQKADLEKSGVSALFGTEQFLSFNLKFFLKNDSFFPTLVSTPLPANINSQEIGITKMTPLPENVTIDIEGNYLAWYRLQRNEKIDVFVEGYTRINPNQTKPTSLSNEQISNLTSTKIFWEKDNQLIKKTLDEIIGTDKSLSNQDKAGLINEYLVNNYKFNHQRLKDGNFERLGVLTALNNPDNFLAAEFTDSFIALARAAGIPAKQIVGIANSNNPGLNPLSFQNNMLHTWPEYFDEKKGWVMIDPTWQNTTGGVDYFNAPDLNRVVLYSASDPSIKVNFPIESKINFTQDKFNPTPKLQIKINSPEEIFSVFPSNAKIRIENLGSGTVGEKNIQVSTSKLSLANAENLITPPIPPLGYIEYEISILPSEPWSSFTDILQVSVDGQKIEKQIIVKPFFTYKIYPLIILGIFIIIFLLYIGSFLIHKNYQREIKVGYKGKTRR